MPFKSQAQRRKFAELMVKGEISPETFEEWNRETGSAKLPERVASKSPKKRASTKSRATTKKKTRSSARKSKSSPKAGRKSAAKRKQ